MHVVQLGYLDNVGAPVIDNVFHLLLDTPANNAIVEAIAMSPAFQAIMQAASGLSNILGPFERATLVKCCNAPSLRPLAEMSTCGKSLL